METATKENVFYQDGNVTVTQARFVASGKTYAMSNISSVSLFHLKRSRKLETFLMLVGLVMLFGEETRAAGIVLGLLGLILLFVLKDKYSVRINSNSGEADGLISKDKVYINKIVEAVNHAIIHRG